MEMKTTTELRKAIKNTTGCDRVRRQADGQWDVLYYNHPHNIASDGSWVLYAMSDKEAQNRIETEN